MVPGAALAANWTQIPGTYESGDSAYVGVQFSQSSIPPPSDEPVFPGILPTGKISDQAYQHLNIKLPFTISAK
jgi:hypothetical protein